MSDTLKPCPFCGGEATAYGDNRIENDWGVYCKNACLLDHEKKEAIAAWNRRSSPRLEALERVAKEIKTLRTDRDEWERLAKGVTTFAAETAAKVSIPDKGADSRKAWEELAAKGRIISDQAAVIERAREALVYMASKHVRFEIAEQKAKEALAALPAPHPDQEKKP